MSSKKSSPKKSKGIVDNSHRLVLAGSIVIAGMMPIMVLFNMLALNVDYMSNWGKPEFRTAETFVQETDSSYVMEVNKNAGNPSIVATTPTTGKVNAKQLSGSGKKATAATMSREPLLLGFGTPKSTQTWYPVLMLGGGVLLLFAAYLLNKDRFSVASKKKTVTLKTKTKAKSKK